VDPGLTGGLCLLTMKGEIALLTKMPFAVKEIDLLELFRYFKLHAPKIEKVFIERSQAFPGMSAAAQFSVGKSFAYVEAMVVANGLPYELVPPSVWTKAIHKGVTPKLKSKEKSLIVAKRLYPGIAEICTTPRGKLLDGLIDALLIARYGLNTMLNTSVGV